MSRPIALAAPAALVVLALGLPAWGQGVGDAALREKQRRERASGGSWSAPGKTITDEDLRSRAEEAPPEDASAPPVAPAEPSSGGVSSAAFLRHLASAEAYLDRCERRLTEARELDRARAYRDEAETAARRGGVHPGAQ